MQSPLDTALSAVLHFHSMNIALLYGRWCSGGPNAFNVATLYRSKGLTGSESFFFNTARGMAERGHRVQVFCDCTDEIPAADTLAGAAVHKLENAAALLADTEVVLAWNEPDLLRETGKIVPGALRVCVQQLNDFDYAKPGYDDHVDLYAYPSRRHLQYMTEVVKAPAAKAVFVSNSNNPEFFEGAETRRHHSIAYCSSPDRGLQWLLDWWPEIRRRVPDAELRIYYKVQTWLDQVRDLWYDHGLREWYEIGFRARYTEECLRRLGRSGENGIHLVGPIPNVDMARELMRTEVMAYPCDTVRWTEGFGVSVLDSMTAGCVPIITDVDCFGETWGPSGAVMIPGRPASRDERWIDAIVRAMTDEEHRAEVTARTRAFAAGFTRQNRALEWERVLSAAIEARRFKAA